MNYFTKTLLKNDKEPIFSENDKYETIETIDTILKYKIENGFCFLEKYRKLDNTFLVSLAYRVPDSVCNPLLGFTYAENKDTRTLDAVISSTVFKNQVLPATFMDAESLPSFKSATPIKAHISMISDRIRPIPNSDEGLFLQGFLNSYLDAPLLKREKGAGIALGYNRSYNEFKDEKHFPNMMKESMFFAKVLEENTITINGSSYTSLTVRTPFVGNAEIIIAKPNISCVNLVDTITEFHIIETTASFLPIADNHIKHNFDDILNLVCKWFNNESGFDNLEDLFDDSIVVYKDLLKVANKKDTALEFLKLKKRMYGNNDYKIWSSLHTVTKVVIDDYDSTSYMCSMLKTDEVRKQLAYWKKVLINHNDHSLDSLKISLDARSYNKFLNQDCILFLERHPFAANLSINETLFITTNENNLINEVYFVGMPVFYDNIKGYDYVRHINNIPISHPKGSSYIDVKSRSNYKKTIDYLEMMVQDPKFKEYDQSLLDATKVFVHSFFEDLKASISEDEVEEKLIKTMAEPKSLRFIFTNEDIPSLSLFMQAFFESCYVMGVDMGNDINELYRANIKNLIKEIKNITFRSFEFEDNQPFVLEKKAQEMFSLTLAHYPEQNLSRDEATENLGYIMLLAGILDCREGGEEFT